MLINVYNNQIELDSDLTYIKWAQGGGCRGVTSPTVVVQSFVSFFKLFSTTPTQFI